MNVELILLSLVTFYKIYAQYLSLVTSNLSRKFCASSDIHSNYPWPSLSQCHASRYIHGHIQGINVWLWTPRHQYS